MARSLGIRLGHRKATLVLLDGSAKRPKLRAHLVVETSADADATPDALGEAVKDAIRAAKLKGHEDQIRLAVDARLAAFRPLALPFADRAKIEEVLKFEVESRLPQWDIEDVVCDFHVRRSTPVESDLLVVAVPKAELASRITALTRAGLEPHEVEIDATALFEAARHAGLLATDAAQLLVHVGERSATLVVAEGGRIASMRAMPLDVVGGAASADAAPSDAEAAEGAEADEAAAPAAAPDPARRRAAAERLARELLRMLAAGQREHAISAVYVCGLPLPELVEFADDGSGAGPHAEVGGVPLAPLDALREAAPELSLEQRLELVPAFGAALHGIGANGLEPHLRREELRYAGKFERLEVPLGVLGLFLLTLTTALYIVDFKVVQAREADLDAWIRSNHNYMIGSTASGSRGRLPLAPEPIKAYSQRIAEEGADGDPLRTPYEELVYLRTLVNGEIARLSNELGTKTDIEPPQSALAALTSAMAVIHANREKLGRFAIRRVVAESRIGTGTQGDYVNITFDFTFWGEDVAATAAYTDLMWALDNEPWVLDVGRPATNTLDGGGGIYVDNVQVQIDTKKLPDAQNAAGAAS